MYVNIKEFEGKIVKRVEEIEKESIIFTFEDGTKYKMYHEQDCCESVTVDDIKGDFVKIIGQKIIKAEKRTNSSDKPEKCIDDSFTWTFYDIETVKEHIQIKWYGESNGYYSEDVSISNITND